jgi:hypothetical protein
VLARILHRLAPQLLGAVHSSRYLGSLARQVTQS